MIRRTYGISGQIRGNKLANPYYKKYMIPTYKQIGYISHTLKANRNMYPELKEMFPPKVKDGADISLAELEIKVSRLERATLSDVISLLMDDKIVEGYRQLDYLIKEH